MREISCVFSFWEGRFVIDGVDGLRGLLDLGGSLGRQVRLGLVRLDQSD